MTPTKPPGPKGKTYQPVTTIESLYESLQWALSGELSTIPPYLCGLYSLSDPTSDTYATIRSVVVEEMLHMMQVANLINAIGQSPSLGRKSVPSYPGFMLHHAVGGPFIQLQAYSPQLARDVFMAIEKPDTAMKMPAPGKPFETVGQFYRAVEQGFENCVKRFGKQKVFPNKRPQITDTYFGPGGGRLVKVTGLTSAKRAIKEITEQGEGASSPKPPMPGQDPFGGCEHYGLRLDGTYGPIIGRPWEMSHYRKFQQLADAVNPGPAVYPMQTNPSAGRFSGLTKELADLFNGIYTLMLQSLEKLFTTGRENWFFEVAFPLMRFALQPLAILLMQTPLQPQADPSAGPNAGPPFAFHKMTGSNILALTQQLHAASPGVVPADFQLWRGTLERVLHSVQRALKAKRALRQGFENGGHR